MKKNLTNGVISLRPFEITDTDYHLKHEDEEFEKWLSGGKSSRQSVSIWIQKNIEYWKADGPVFNFAVVDEKGTLVGMVEARPIDPTVFETREGDMNISYGIYLDNRGRGYAVMAVELMMQFLKKRNYKRAIIRVNPNNAASLSVPNKLNFIELKNASKDDLIAFEKIL